MIAFGHWDAMMRADGGTVVDTGPVFHHVHHCHTKVHPEGICHKEAITGQEGQPVS